MNPENAPVPAPPRHPPRKNRSPFRNYLLLLITGFALVVSWDEVGFFLFLLLMGGVLSYLGDQLGSYCGKQRLSLFGLRPRYTAGLINLGTGLLITVLTFGGAVSMSEDVRVAVFRVSELRQQASRLRLQEASLKGDIARVGGELQVAQAAVAAADKARQSAEGERADAQRQTAKLVAANQELSSQNSALSTSNLELAARREALSRSIQEKLVEIDRLNLALEKKETAPVVISRGQELLDETVAVPLEVTTDQLREVVGQLASRVSARVELLDVQFDRRSAEYVTRFGVEKVLLRMREIADYYRNGVEGGRIEARLVPRHCHIVPVSTRNVSVGEPLSRIVFDVRPNVLLFTAGQEVARTLVDGSVSPDQILDGLLYFDQQVRTVLRENGVSQSVLRRGSAASEPARLFELVRIAEDASGSGEQLVVLCRATADVYAFGDVALSYALESTPSSSVETASLAGQPRRSSSLGPLEASDPAPFGGELVLPEPKLAEELLLDVGGGLGGGPAPSVLEPGKGATKALPGS